MSSSDEGPEYIVVFEEKNHVHDLSNKEVRTIEFSDYFKKPDNTAWVKFEDNIPGGGWDPYLDSFTLDYTLGLSVESIGELSATWGRKKQALDVCSSFQDKLKTRLTITRVFGKLRLNCKSDFIDGMSFLMSLLCGGRRYV